MGLIDLWSVGRIPGNGVRPSVLLGSWYVCIDGMNETYSDPTPPPDVQSQVDAIMDARRANTTKHIAMTLPAVGCAAMALMVLLSMLLLAVLAVVAIVAAGFEQGLK